MRNFNNSYDLVPVIGQKLDGVAPLIRGFPPTGNDFVKKKVTPDT